MLSTCCRQPLLTFLPYKPVLRTDHTDHFCNSPLASCLVQHKVWQDLTCVQCVQRPVNTGPQACLSLDMHHEGSVYKYMRVMFLHPKEHPEIHEGDVFEFERAVNLWHADL